MNYFELGFISQAKSLGYSTYEAEHFLKRASEHPQFSQIAPKYSNEIDEHTNTEYTPEALLEKFKQDFIHNDLGNKKIKINL